MALPFKNAGAALAPGSYRVTEKALVSQEKWDGWLAGSPGGGHVFQSHAWGEFKRRLGWRPVRLALEREGEVVGVGQFLLYDTPLFSGSLMYAPKGPWLPWEDAEAVGAFFGGVAEVARKQGAHTVKIEPEVLEGREDVKSLLGDLGFRKFRWDLNFRTKMVVDLGPSEEDLLAGMRKSTRYSIRRAAREGVRVVEDDSPAARDAFWRLFETTADRQNFWHRPRGYLESMTRAMGAAGRAHLFLASHDGEPLAAAYVLNLGEKVFYLYGASGNEKRNLQPTYALQWEMMRWAKQRGAKQYDMMAVANPDELQEDHPLYGVYRFKLGFGSEMVSHIGCFDLPVKRVRADLWNKVEPNYYRLYQRLKGDVYY